MYAVDGGYTTIVDELLAHRADPNVKASVEMVVDLGDHSDHSTYFAEETVLMRAVKCRHLEIIQCLLKYGADVTTKIGGETILEIANRSYPQYGDRTLQQKIIHVLKEAGAR